MFYLASENGDRCEIVDTDDGSVEYLTKAQVWNAKKLGIDICGVYSDVMYSCYPRDLRDNILMAGKILLDEYIRQNCKNYHVCIRICHIDGLWDLSFHGNGKINYSSSFRSYLDISNSSYVIDVIKSFGIRDNYDLEFVVECRNKISGLKFNGKGV